MRGKIKRNEAAADSKMERGDDGEEARVGDELHLCEKAVRNEQNHSPNPAPGS